MLKRIILSTALAVIMFSCSPQSTYAQETREQLMESALINAYRPLLDKEIHSSSYCAKVVRIIPLGAPNRLAPKYEIRIQAVTYTGAHNPPHDLITVDILDDVFGARVIRKSTVRNVSIAYSYSPLKIKFAVTGFRPSSLAHTDS